MRRDRIGRGDPVRARRHGRRSARPGPAVLLPAAHRSVHPRAARAAVGASDLRARGARGERPRRRRRVPAPARGVADPVRAARMRRRRAARRSWPCVYAERSEFSFDPDRFEAAYDELEQALYEGRAVTTVVAPLLGIALDRETTEIALGEGLALVRGDALDDAPPDAVWGDAEEPNVLAVLTVAQDRAAPPPVSVARVRFRRTLTALRLFERGGFALGPVAWTRIDAGSWRSVPLGGSGRPRLSRRIPAEHEDELRAFCNLVARRTPTRWGDRLGAGPVRDGLRAPRAVRGADRLSAGAEGAARARGPRERPPRRSSGRDLRQARGPGGGGRAHRPRDLARARGDRRPRPGPDRRRRARRRARRAAPGAAQRRAVRPPRAPICARSPTTCWPRRSPERRRPPAGAADRAAATALR